MKSQKSKIKSQKLFIVGVLVFLFLIPVQVQADLVPCGGPNEPPCELCHLFVMFDRIIHFVFLYIIFPVATILLVIGGGMFMFSGGDPGKIKEAKSILFSTIIGLIIIFSAWAIVTTFMVGVGVAEWVGPAEGWYRILCPL